MGSIYYCNSVVKSIIDSKGSINWDCSINPFDSLNPSTKKSINKDESFERLSTTNEWDYLVYTGGPIGKASSFGIDIPSSLATNIKELTIGEDLLLGFYGQSKLYLPLLRR